ncbi:PKD domain-containing protein [Niabella aquatica]
METTGTLPASVQFNSSSSQHARSYQWDFGDGASSAEATPRHGFAAAGTYHVTLTVNGDGGTDSKSQDVVISFEKPKANFTFSADNPGVLPTTVRFTSSSANATSCKWDFGDGSFSEEQQPVHQFLATGNYEVKLTVTGLGGTDDITKSVSITLSKPKAAFTYSIINNGDYPVRVNFTNTSTGADSYQWDFDNGDVSDLFSPVDRFFAVKAFQIRLVAANAAGKDTVTVPVSININKPAAGFSYTVLNPSSLPLNIRCSNSSQKAASYSWDFGDGGRSSEATPQHIYTQGGTYTITLYATNPGGTTVVTQTINVSPYPASYTTFGGETLTLYAWEGEKVAVLSRNKNLDATVMFAWAKTMDKVYGYYKLCTGREPGTAKMINGHTTIADVASTCGAGCGYLGATGIELQNTYFDVLYNGIKNNNQYDQAVFYEFGRNFWFYGNQLAYKANDPVTTGYAVLMRFLSLDATGVQGGPFNYYMTYSQFKSAVEGLVDKYTANTSLNWSNTLGQGTGVPGEFGGGTDLFASFCMRLMRDYGGQNFIQQVWKKAATMPTATTTQDAVDNFILASCAAANKNLTTLFTTTWRWPMSDAAKVKAGVYP